MEEIIVKPFSGINVITTEYDMQTQNAIRTMKSINFDKSSPTTFSKIVVIRMTVTGVTKISNIKLGIVKSSEHLDTGGSLNTDGSVTIGNFGIEHSDSIIVKTSLSSFFPGINDTEDTANTNNVLLNNLTNNSSEYVYLNLKNPELVSRGFVGYKWFFDFV